MPSGIVFRIQSVSIAFRFACFWLNQATSQEKRHEVEVELSSSPVRKREEG
jgi:hypothetical protein